MAVVFSTLDATWLQFRTHHIWYHNTYYYDIIIFSSEANTYLCITTNFS